MKRKKKIFIGIFAIVIAGILLFTYGKKNNKGYYLTVEESNSVKHKLSGDNLRIGGRVEEGSVQWISDSSILKFDLADEQGPAKIIVHFKGLAPNSFKPGSTVIVEGIWDSGIFTAISMKTKCSWLRVK